MSDRPDSGPPTEPGGSWYDRWIAAPAAGLIDGIISGAKAVIGGIISGVKAFARWIRQHICVFLIVLGVVLMIVGIIVAIAGGGGAAVSLGALSPVGFAGVVIFVIGIVLFLLGIGCLFL
jgi:hypothetical protein